MGTIYYAVNRLTNKAVCLGKLGYAFEETERQYTREELKNLMLKAYAETPMQKTMKSFLDELQKLDYFFYVALDSKDGYRVELCKIVGSFYHKDNRIGQTLSDMLE